jgi:hypothetical protein
MVSMDCPKVSCLTALAISSNSADAGSSILLAIVAFAFSRIGSEGPEAGPNAATFTLVPTSLFAFVTGCGGGGEASGVRLVGDETFSLSNPSFVRGEFGFTAFVATGDVFAFFAAFFDRTFVAAELVLDRAGFRSGGELAAVLKKHGFEVQASSIACGAGGQLQPIKVTDKTPTKKILMQFHRLAKGVS